MLECGYEQSQYDTNKNGGAAGGVASQWRRALSRQPRCLPVPVCSRATQRIFRKCRSVCREDIVCVWARRDSNPHSFRNQFLKLAPVPIRLLARMFRSCPPSRIRFLQNLFRLTPLWFASLPKMLTTFSHPARKRLRAFLGGHSASLCVRPAGFEPATLGLRVPCSTGLSYGRVCRVSGVVPYRNSAPIGFFLRPAGLKMLNRAPPPTRKRPALPLRHHDKINFYRGAEGGSRTHTGLRPGNFKSPMSAVPSPRRGLGGNRTRASGFCRPLCFHFTTRPQLNDTTRRYLVPQSQKTAGS